MFRRGQDRSGSFDGETQFVFAERFQEVAMGLSFARPGDRVQIGAGGNIHNGSAADLPNPSGGFDAIHGTGEVNVHEHQIRVQFLHPLYGALP